MSRESGNENTDKQKILKFSKIRERETAFQSMIPFLSAHPQKAMPPFKYWIIFSLSIEEGGKRGVVPLPCGEEGTANSAC